VSFLLDVKANVNETVTLEGFEGETPLFAALRLAPGRLFVPVEAPQLVDALLHRGADPCDCNALGQTPLFAAAEAKACAKTFKALLNAGGDGTAPARDGFTPIHLAIINNLPAQLELMLEKAEDAVPVDGTERVPAPLTLAAGHGNYDAAQLLVDYRAFKPAPQPAPSMTPLMAAVLHAASRVSKLPSAPLDLPLALVELLAVQEQTSPAPATRWSMSWMFQDPTPLEVAVRDNLPADFISVLSSGNARTALARDFGPGLRIVRQLADKRQELYSVRDLAGHPRLVKVARASSSMERDILATCRQTNIARLHARLPLSATHEALVLDWYREPLAAVIARRGALPESTIVLVLKQMVDALCALHQCGFVHLDVEPRTIAVVNSFTFVLTDFDNAAQRGVPTHAMGRSFQFEALEVWRPPADDADTGGDVRMLSDVWSLGVTLHAMATGAVRGPFAAFVDEVDLMTHLIETIDEPLPMLEGLSPQLALLVSHMLAKDYRQRIPATACKEAL